MSAEISIFLRTEDGPAQQFLLQQNARGHHVEFLDILHGIALPHPYTSQNRPQRYLRTASAITTPVCLFVNRPLAAINPFFIEALFKEALRTDCGLVTGIALDPNRRNLNSGAPFDASFVQPLGASAKPVSHISAFFFATRRECLAAAGGLSILSPSDMQNTAALLAGNARRQNLQILCTPCAVATLLRP
jgi:hypothetical protein